MGKTMPDKIASTLSYGTSGGLIVGGWGGWFEWFHGLDWNFIGLSSGVLLGIATFAVNVYYKRRDDARKEASHQFDIEQDRLRTEAIQNLAQRSSKLTSSDAPAVIAALNTTIKSVDGKNGDVTQA
ncbi:class II holin family protein [Pantoea ananatis]|jgi:predicted negative regulator of RcsB-dependent stress response|uniref:class II holin family protein n=1 Tax=Pantoea stewartii TaxID=66269 RepID=UPI0021E961EF|nr:class II holin family protein [Pantoea stewartii]UYK97790.1 class II holin family protein [Pantoea stewartii]UYL01314.1 class II holin family protein [Pantoea ananatis]